MCALKNTVLMHYKLGNDWSILNEYLDEVDLFQADVEKKSTLFFLQYIPFRTSNMLYLYGEVHKESFNL